MLTKLRTLQPNLSFTHKQMSETLRQIALQTPSWRLDKNEIDDFSRRVADRIRAMCRHLNNAASRRVPPKWVAQIFALKNTELTFKGLENAELEKDHDQGEEHEEEERCVDEIVDLEGDRDGDDVRGVGAEAPLHGACLWLGFATQ